MSGGTQMRVTPTHELRLADGYGTTPCEAVVLGRFLSTVRVRSGTYWERGRVETRVVCTENLTRLTEVAP